jgi:uncharacterized RDD family membrane protein YckC
MPPTAALGGSGGQMGMPQGGDSRQPNETGGQAGGSPQQPGGAPRQGTVPGQDTMPGQPDVPGQGGAPGQENAPGEQWTYGSPQGQGYGPQGQAYGAPPPAAGEPMGGPMQGRPISPVNEAETRVTGRRVVQYIIDAIIYGVIAAVISWALDRGTGGVHAFLVFVTVVLDVLLYLFYWAWIPDRQNGQTLGMMAMGIRIISADGGRANFVQLAVRSVLLVLFSPLSLVVGIIVMMFSRYRQRTGDHMARTMVVRAQVQPAPARQMYAGAGQAGYR